MKTDILLSLSRLSDADLVAGVKSLVAREKDATAQIVAHLAELDTRDVHLREGYPSLFVYCRDALGLSEWEAYNRIEVGRAARRFPEILDMLADGSIHFTAARLLAPHLSASNHRDVLESARGKRKVEVQEIVARLAPRPDVRTSIRPLPTVVPGLAPAVATAVIEPAASATTASGPAVPPAVVGAPAPNGDIAASSVPRPPVVPLSPGRYKLQLTIGGETLDIDPCALGGEASVEQIALRCRRHNDYEGRLYFGTRRSKSDSRRAADPSATDRAGESRGPDLFRNKSAM